MASFPSALAGSLERPVQNRQHDYMNEVERTQERKSEGQPASKNAHADGYRGAPLAANPLDRGRYLHVRREVRDRSAHVSSEGCVVAKKKGRAAALPL